VIELQRRSGIKAIQRPVKSWRIHNVSRRPSSNEWPVGSYQRLVGRSLPPAPAESHDVTGGAYFPALDGGKMPFRTIGGLDLDSTFRGPDSANGRRDASGFQH
jgi:hypothetical protein